MRPGRTELLPLQLSFQEAVDKTAQLKSLREHLPTVMIIEDRPVEINNTPLGMRFEIRDPSNTCIGSFILDDVKYSEVPTKYIREINIDEAKRGFGYGKATALALLEHLGDIKLSSGTSVSRGAKPICDWLVEHGLAELKVDRCVDESRPNYNYSFSQYETL